VTVEEFLRYVAQLRARYPGGPLTLTGPAHDNATRDQLDFALKEPWRKKKNTFDRLFGGGEDGQHDFVWLGNGVVRIPAFFGTGGHPALAGMDLPYCAGELHYDDPPWVNFKSGHYHPKVGHAVHFVCDMIERSLPDGGDALVRKLSAMRLRIYLTDEEESAYPTCLDDLAEKMGLVVTRPAPATATAAAAPGSPPRSPRAPHPASLRSSREAEDRGFTRAVAVGVRMEDRLQRTCHVCGKAIGERTVKCMFCEQMVCATCVDEFMATMRDMICKSCMKK
jgi:hypothetical protein